MLISLNPSISLLISIASILTLVRLKVHIGFAVAVGCLFLILVDIPLKTTPSILLQTLIDQQTWTLFIVVPSTLTFASLMEQKGMLTKLALTLEGIGPRLAIHILPAVIGLVPMPAGALVAATAVKDLSKRLELSSEKITFINYWFRHIWEFSLPMYPTIIIISTILSVPLTMVVRVLVPMTGLAIVMGSVVSYKIMGKTLPPENKEAKHIKTIVTGFIKTAWPILIIIILILSNVPAWIVFPSVLIVFILQQSVTLFELKKALRNGLNPRILLLLFAVMLFKMIIGKSGVAEFLVNNIQNLGLPSLFILIGLPMLIGLAIGYGPAISGISFPLLIPFIITGTHIQTGALLLASVSGMIGQLLSPAHLCFNLTVEYFNTTLGKVYRYTVPLSIALLTIAIGIYYLIR